MKNKARLLIFWYLIGVSIAFITIKIKKEYDKLNEVPKEFIPYVDEEAKARWDKWIEKTTKAIDRWPPLIAVDELPETLQEFTNRIQKENNK